MAKIRCRYCDSVFEYTGQNRCPNCGASLSDNPDAGRAMQEQEKTDGYDDELRKKVTRYVFKTMDEVDRGRKLVMTLFVIVFLIIFVTALSMILTSFFRMRSTMGI